MKTLIKSTLFIAAATLISLNTFASGFEFKEEQYIDDIPFNTEQIAAKASFEIAVSEEFNFDEEKYVDDIQFSEKYLSNLSLYASAVSVEFNFEEEKYIDDIPFLTNVSSNDTSGNIYAKAK